MGSVYGDARTQQISVAILLQGSNRKGHSLMGRMMGILSFQNYPINKQGKVGRHMGLSSANWFY